jgi:hypothetical protein
LSSFGSERIEPSDDFDATTSSVCDCENCHQCRAAKALHFDCFKSQFLVSLDADLQCVVAGWGNLAAPFRGAILALVSGELGNM